MMILIDRKFNEEQLLLETFSPKMHIERDICKKVICRGVKTPIKSSTWGGAGVLICYVGHHSRTFSALLPIHFATFFPYLPRA